MRRRSSAEYWPATVLALYCVDLVVQGPACLESSERLLVERVHDRRAICGGFAVDVCCLLALFHACASTLAMMQRTLCIALLPVACFSGLGRSLLDFEGEFLRLRFHSILHSAAAQKPRSGVHGAWLWWSVSALCGEACGEPTLPRAIRGHDASGPRHTAIAFGACR
jgi:hypothetical protein